MRVHPTAHFTLLAAILIPLIPGCASFRDGPFLGEKFDDPPQLSPYNQPLTRQPLTQPQQQVTPYRGFVPGPLNYRGPVTRAPASPFIFPYGLANSLWGRSPRAVPGRPNGFHAGRPYGGMPSTLPATPAVPLTPSVPNRTFREAEPGGTVDDLGTDLGAPRTYETPRTYEGSSDDELPSFPYPQDPRPEETIRQRPDGDADRSGEERTSPGEASEGAAALVLDVSDPKRVALSEAVAFEVVIRNPHPAAVENVVVECHFGEGLTFAETPERALRQRLGSLGSSESRTIDLSLTAEQTGTQCVDFTLTADGRKTASTQRCVEVFDPDEPATDMAIDLVAPKTRHAGGKLECVLTVQNPTGRDVSGIVAAIHHDAALIPREASSGAIQKPGSLQWDLGLLRVDERVQIQVEFACPSPAEHACIDATVTGRQLTKQREEVCVTIRPRPTLDVAIADSRDPVPVGETTTYLVTITNRGLEAIDDVRLDARLDGGLEIIRRRPDASAVSFETLPQPGPRAATYMVEGPIAVDDSRTLKIDVRGTTTGRGGLRIRATELATSLQVDIDEPTVVNPPLLEWPSLRGTGRD